MNLLLLRKHSCQAATGTAPCLGKNPASVLLRLWALPRRQTPFHLPLEFMYGQLVMTPASPKPSPCLLLCHLCSPLSLSSLSYSVISAPSLPTAHPRHMPTPVCTQSTLGIRSFSLLQTNIPHLFPLNDRTPSR